MPLPGDLTTTVVTGTFTDPAGNPMRGTVTIWPSSTLLDATGNVIIPQLQRAYQLFNGSFRSAPLVATDNTDINPSGWGYVIQIALQEVPSYQITVLLPASVSPVDLSALSPATSVPELASYLSMGGGTLTGKLTLTGSTPLQIPGGAALGEVLTSDASGNASWGPSATAPATSSTAGIVELTSDLGGTATAPHVVGTHLASPLPVNQGGTGSMTQNFADLTNAQNIGGVKTFTGEVIVPTPGAAGDAVTKAYADAISTGLQVKPSAVAATTGSETFTVSAGNVTTISGTTLDTTVSPQIGDFILVKDAPVTTSGTSAGSVRSSATGNGLYSVTGNTTNLSVSRATAMSSSNSPVGAFVFTTGGTTNAGAGYVVTTPASGAFTYGSGAIQWTQFSSAGTVSAGTGLSQTGSVISLISPVSVGLGGTGQMTQQAALDALAGAQTSGDYLRGNGTHVVMSAIQGADLPAVFANVFSPMAYGAAGNGTADDTTAVQAAITAAEAVTTGATVQIDKSYLVSGANDGSALSCTGTNVLITGSGTLIQSNTGNNYNLLSMSSSTNCRVQGITFQGIGGSVPLGHNSGIYGLNVAGLTVEDCKFTLILFRPVYILNGTDIKVKDCVAYACSEGFGFNSTLRGSFQGCTIRDPQVPNSGVFYDGFTLESTNTTGGNQVPCQDIQITGCKTKGLQNAQSILMHAGIRVAITGNVFEDAECGISVNPFNATDTTQDVTITGNICLGTKTSQSYTVTDGVLNGTTTVTSATANFGSGSVGRVITGTGIPAATTIASVTNSTTAIMSASGTAGTGVSLTIGTIYEIASNGINISGGAGLTTLSCTTTATSATLTTSGSFTTAGIVAGMQVTGTGIATNTQVASVQSATSLTLAANATVSATNTLTFFTGPQNVTVTGNTVRGFNAVVQNPSAGGINMSYATSVVCSGNTVTGSYGNGIVVQNPCSDLVITGNEIDNMVPLGSVEVAIAFLSSSGGSTGHVSANLIDGGSGTLSGIRSDASSAGMMIRNDNTYIGLFTNILTSPNHLVTINETSHVLTTNPPASGTSYRYNAGLMGSVMVFLPAYATSPGTAGTAAVSIANTGTPSTNFTKQISGSTTSSQTDIVMFAVPPGYWFTVTLTGVTLGTGYVQRL